MTPADLYAAQRAARVDAFGYLDRRLGELQRAYGLPCLHEPRTGDIVTRCPRGCGHSIILHGGDANPALDACLGCTS